MTNTNKKTVYTRIQNKLDLEVNWKKATGFIPLAGELIIYDKEVDAEGNTLSLPEGRTEPFIYARYKLGDGVTPVNELAFIDYVIKTELNNGLAGKVSKVASTDNAIVRFNGTTGDVQNSKASIDDNGNLTLDGSTIKFKTAMNQVASPTVLPAFIDNNSANGIGYVNTSDLTVGNATSATKATQDGNGNVITTTYAMKTDLSNLAPTSYVDNKVASMVDAAPETLNTLNELAAALGDDPNFATTVATNIGKKVDKTTKVNGHELSGDVTVTKSDVGLGNVDNTADAEKIVRYAEQSGFAASAQNSNSAIHDGNGNNIASTYATLTQLDSKAPSGYGFGESANVLVSDIDSVDKTGFYQFVTDVFDGTPMNYYLLHQIHTTNYACQTAIKVIDANVVYQRIQENGAWKNWIKYITSGNIGDQSVKYADSAWSCNEAGKFSTARNINGVAFDGTKDITVYSPRERPGVTKVLTTNGWYRVAKIRDSHAFSGQLHILSLYSYNAPISANIAFNAAYGTGCGIVQLSALGVVNKCISHVRAVRYTGEEWYIEVYYSGNTTGGNPVRCAFTSATSYSGDDAVTMVDFEAGSVPDGYIVTEFALSTCNVKAGYFEGNLVGNASTADHAGEATSATYASLHAATGYELIHAGSIGNHISGKVDKEVHTDADLNTIIASGFYRLGGTNANKPAGCEYGQLIVSRGADTITQIASSYHLGTLFTRSGNPSECGGAGGWTEWRTLIDSSNIGSQSVNYANSAANDGNGNNIAITYMPKTDYRIRDYASGYYKINITSTEEWMLAFTIRLYQHYRCTDILISGYNYGTNYWYSPKAKLIADTDNGSIPVIFGYDSPYNLWVAIPAGNYTGLSITNATNGYSQIYDMQNLFTITNVASEDALSTIQERVEAYSPYQRNETVTRASEADHAAWADSAPTAGSASEATNAYNDHQGRNIVSTYATKSEVMKSVSPTVPSGVGWYRIATIQQPEGISFMLTLASLIDPLYGTGSAPTTTATFSISKGYTGPRIVQLSNTYFGSTPISKIRAIYKSSGDWYVDIYASTPSMLSALKASIYNVVACSDEDVITMHECVSADIPSGYNTKEFSISSLNDVKADTFEGKLVGTATWANGADTATKAAQDGNGNNIVNTYATKAEMQQWINQTKTLASSSAAMLAIGLNDLNDANAPYMFEFHIRLRDQAGRDVSHFISGYYMPDSSYGNKEASVNVVKCGTGSINAGLPTSATTSIQKNGVMCTYDLSGANIGSSVTATIHGWYKVF